MNCFLQTEHHTSAFVLSAVIILINCSVTGICIICHTVLIQSCVSAFIISEQRILTLPRPDSCCHLSQSICRFAIDPIIDLTGDGICHIVLYKWTKCIHRCNAVTTCCLYIIIADQHIFVTIFQEDFLIKLCSLKLVMCISITDSNSPTAHLIHKASLNCDIFITCYSGQFFVLRTKCCHIDTTVIHMLIIYITIHIMDQQITQCDTVSYTFVFCYNSNTCAVHLVSKGIVLADNFVCFVCDLQIFYDDIFCIIQQNCGRYIPAIYMSW